MNNRFEELKQNLLPRFWDTENKEMLYPFIDIMQQNIRYDAVKSNLEDSFEQLFFNPRFISMKPTGLRDKNGVLCYDGDIIKSSFHLWLVRWSDELQWLAEPLTQERFFIDRKPFWFVFDGEENIYGNIHSNPELIEVQK